MRTQNVFGASSLHPSAGRLLAVVVLGAGLVLTGSSASAQVPATSGSHGSGSHGSGWDDGRVSRWERDDRARVGGVEYTWPKDHTWTYDGLVCPDGDVAKTDTHGDPATVEIVAPEGKVIDSYCVKSAQGPAGGGARIVEVDEPVERLTIAYPRDGKASAISHYSVCFRDAERGEKSPEERRREPEPTTAEPAVEDEQPPATAPAPAAAPDEVPAPPQTATPEVTPSAESEPVVVAEPETPSASATPVVAPAVPAGDDPSPSPEAGRLAATDEGTQATAQTQTGELAFTGAKVTGIVVAAVVLIALGTLAIHRSRRRADASR